MKHPEYVYSLRTRTLGYNTKLFRWKRAPGDTRGLYGYTWGEDLLTVWRSLKRIGVPVTGIDLKEVKP